MNLIPLSANNRHQAKLFDQLVSGGEQHLWRSEAVMVSPSQRCSANRGVHAELALLLSALR
jgi:hypothetical protein